MVNTSVIHNFYNEQTSATIVGILKNATKQLFRKEGQKRKEEKREVIMPIDQS